jgi:NAD(P)-dependent dehydrogenase (short-subunit alcohol dehydrogenase family)
LTVVVGLTEGVGRECKMDGRFAGRAAIVTGGARGIGLAVAQRLHAGGASVVIADLDGDEAERQAAALGGRALAAPVDVTDPEGVEQMVTAAATHWGRLDILVNCAGVLGPSAPVEAYPLDAWRRILATNLDGVFLCCRAALPHMLAAGWGRIVNLASIAGKEGNPNAAAYAASKGGVIAFTKALAKEVATRGILVNAVAPALIETEMTRDLPTDVREYVTERIPMGRAGTAPEVAALVAWLCSEECSFSTGAVYDISGGRATY